MYGFVLNDPVGNLDLFGLWSPGAHDAMIQHALKGKASASCIEQLQVSSRKFDKATQSAAESYKHAMRREGESVENAKSKTAAFIRSRLETAKDLAKKGQCYSAMDALGQALHPIMDSSSPMHTDSSGNPKEWNPLWPVGHSPNDFIGNETINDITDAIYKSMDEQIQAAFDNVKGCNCCKP